MDNLAQTQTQTPDRSAVLKEATQDLIEHLLQSEPFMLYQEAKRQLQDDPEAGKLLDELDRVQRAVREQQYSGTVTPSDLIRLRYLQAEVRHQATIQRHEQAEQQVVQLLKQVNQEISQALNIDFASLTQRSSCC